jgi:GMP synthase-like glutamine amidotransferase
MHGDQVVSLPPGAKVLARSEHCEVAMFRVGDTMLGIEGHPEFSAAFNEALIRARRDRIGADVAERALESVNGPTDGPVVGKWIAEFLARRRKNPE